jgi:hypothetical protein
LMLRALLATLVVTGGVHPFHACMPTLVPPFAVT